ncbi:unnamed protein product [Heligmosomoides polygyrus]|uniref:TGF_BETA_2 domain-containing protein n=1 Tax=Heligmosomoides polygyrus TaxID=6339 RepID=A0A3P8DV02_HELPZ|nr:unnamed protein product [Heligmosomoides polygyrus]
MSVMSPRLFSLFPEKGKKFHRHRLLSPTILSFQKDGYFSLPTLFDIITSDGRYQQLLLDVVMDVSGAGNVLQVEQALHGLNVTFLGSLSKEEKVARIEQDIRALAALGIRRKRKAVNGKSHRVQSKSVGVQEQNEETDHEMKNNKDAKHTENDYGEASREGGIHEESDYDDLEEKHQGVEFVTLSPIAFTHLIRGGAVLEVVTLSPQAFIDEILFPRLLLAEILSPRVFVAAILSPNALVARILSPTAFRLDVLSPRALHTWIVSPEVLLGEILTPRFLDPRILSPQTLVIEVLSPGTGYRIRFYVDNALLLTSLGPFHFELSSKPAILSPHILGGAHGHEEVGVSELAVDYHRESLEDGTHENESDQGRPNISSKESLPCMKAMLTPATAFSIIKWADVEIHTKDGARYIDYNVCNCE